MNLSIISGAFRVFRAGEEVADPALWKARQIDVNKIVILLAAVAQLAKAAGYETHLDSETIAYLAAGILAVVNWGFTLATSSKVGIGPAGGTVRAEPAPVRAAPVAVDEPAAVWPFQPAGMGGATPADIRTADEVRASSDPSRSSSALLP